MKALVESFAATLLDAPALGGIMTVLSKSSSSAWTLSSSTSVSDPRSKSTGGLGGITLLTFGSLGGIGAEPSGAEGIGADSGLASGSGVDIGGIGADPNGVVGIGAGLDSAAVSEPDICGMGADPSDDTLATG